MVDSSTSLTARIAALHDTPGAQVVHEMEAIADALAAKEEALRMQEVRIAAQLELLQRLDTPRRTKIDSAPTTKMVTLNVGGTLFKTARETLLRVPGSYFEAMLSSDTWRPNDDGAYFLDLDARLFACVMRFLRTGTLPCSELDDAEASDLRDMLDYLQIGFENASRPVLCWDPKHSSPWLLFHGSSTSQVNWKPSIVIASTPATTFAVRVQLGSLVDVGFTVWEPSMPVPDPAKPIPGWFFKCEKGDIYSQPENRTNIVQHDATAPLCSILLQMTWHHRDRRVSFAINGITLPARLECDPKTECLLYPMARVCLGSVCMGSVELLPL
ncbi:hypothetical protein SPRG_05832 [Saprolegnia parasitica CBS 223.65]|uniref:BTB domain-containing protein n=1 Tax=Saprolegnia parasitica (strain CBS 223.65) TaxID=695850 RepID=A0A067CJE3_SAPPC|nr:hypothetical protein SPRG_05832 [Saprolegnia parasitica CBS 223.65]KDO29295.1 hypothetical protein SPRG_05832 [Saprolegnia parasitica CBS 223.65]|eukprot:XP_012199802.1 hypothetical protein SPRG_05832 [Saprolegnia parasitica CBS 223.65]